MNPGSQSTGGCATLVTTAGSPRSEAIRMASPRPGTFWRVRQDIDAQHDHRRNTNALAKDTILLLRHVEAADGEALVYIFAPHPSLPKPLQLESRFHADDFYGCFELAPDGEQIRQQEIAQLLHEMDQVKQQMMAPPPDAPPAGLLSFDPAEQHGAPGQPLASPQQINAMVVHAERIREDAERRSDWIVSRSKKLGHQATILANFHQERATAALARAHEQLEGVKALLRTADNLRLYTGEGISVLPLLDGEPADPAEPITIYQDVLSFDEETLILLDQGGADHTRVDELAKALADSSLLSRMIPAERGITLVRFRATFKEFVAGADDLASLTFNAQMSRESMRLRLLVRDGQRLSLVDIPDVLDGIRQLMPSTGEQDAYFLDESFSRRGQPPRRVTRDHLDFPQRRRAQMGALDGYGKVLIALWGLRDRAELFENGPMPLFTNWLDPQEQDFYLRLVSLDSLLPESRPSYAEWRNGHNRYFAPGVTVVVQAAGFITASRLPAAFSNSFSNPSQIYELDPGSLREGCVVGRVASDATGLFIPVVLRYAGYQSRVRRDTISAKFYLQFHGHGLDPSNFLVLDRVHAPDLSYYLQSRRERRSYPDYVQLFRVARDCALQRQAGEAPIRAALRQALLDGAVPHAPELVELQITDAIAVARAARRTHDLPAVGTAAFKSFLTSALDALHSAATGDAQKVRSIEAWSSSAARQPLRLVHAGKRGYRLYLVPLDAEHDPRLGPPAHASVATVTFGRDGAVTLGPIARELLRARTGELVIHDWEWEIDRDPASTNVHARDQLPQAIPAGASAWLRLNTKYLIPYATAVQTLDMGAHQSRAFVAGINPDELAKDAMAFSVANSKGSVARLTLSFAIGTAIHHRDGQTPVVLVASVDAWRHAYAHGTEATRDAVRAMTSRRYQHPETWLSRLDNPLEWKVFAVPLDTVSKYRLEARIPPGWGGQLMAKEDVLPRSGSGPRFTITSITAAGADMFPWLLAVAQRPLE